MVAALPRCSQCLYDENNESDDFDLDFDNYLLVGENNPGFATVVLQLAELAARRRRNVDGISSAHSRNVG